MAEHLSIARPYAKALFAVALQENKLDKFYQDLNLVAEVVSNVDVLKLLKGPKLIREEGKLILDKVIDDELAFKQFMLILHQEARLCLIPEIFTVYEQLYQEYNNILEITVVAAVEPAGGMLKALSEKLGAKFNRSIEVVVKIDPKVIGGALVQIPELDLEIDGTVKGKLKQLAEHLIM